jgi:hypothetical protein
MDNLLYPALGAELHLAHSPQGSPLHVQVLVGHDLVAEESYSTWAERKGVALPHTLQRSKLGTASEWAFDIATAAPGIPAVAGLFKRLLGTAYRLAHEDVDRKDFAVRLATIQREPAARVQGHTASLSVVRPPWAGVGLDIAKFAAEELMPTWLCTRKTARIDKWLDNTARKRPDDRSDAANKLHRLEAPFGLLKFLTDEKIA